MRELIILAALGGFGYVGRWAFMAGRNAHPGLVQTARSVFGIVLSGLALGALLLVIAPRVPPEAKDGTFGAAGGIVLGVILINFVQASWLLGYGKRGSFGVSPGTPPALPPEVQS